MLYTKCERCQSSGKVGYEGLINCGDCRGEGYVPVDLAAMREAISTAIWDAWDPDEGLSPFNADAMADAVLAAIARQGGANREGVPTGCGSPRP